MNRTAARVALLTALALAVLLPASAASAKELSVSRGDVKATLTYSQDSNSETKADRLTIVRAGQTLYDAVPHPSACHGSACEPAVGFGPNEPALVVRDLDRDSEPEVVYTAFTGGAHCCTVGQFFSLKADASGYRSVSRNFGDPGFRIEDLNHDGRPEVVTADDSFAFRFTSFAFSGLPLSVLRYDHGRFPDITSSFPGRLRSEAGQFWRGYLKLRSHRDDTPRGLVAAWAADQYRLGRRKHVLAILRREVARGRLASPGGGAKFVRTLDRFLRRRGYA